MTINDKYREMSASAQPEQTAQTDSETSQNDSATMHLHTSAEPKRSNGLWLGVLLAVVLLVAAMLSCPKEDAHKQAVEAAVKGAMTVLADEDGSLQGNAFASILINAAANYYVAPLLSAQSEYHDYVVFSTSSLYFEGEDHTVSFGIYGHVFTVSKKRLAEEMKGYWDRNK